ncbi:YqzK family protein [Scopulibacillus darangshiensis]|uniref:YqzK family protein n=1 Tax=Scopulibacillus darangshiensis TaxID=442528 RepID=UPI001FB4B102|nr:YqzK family protein [Scopulibacillus darangshiensis]
MKASIKIIIDTIKVAILFSGCTIGFYFALQWLDHNYESYHKYDEPSGRAVKVDGTVSENTESSMTFRLIDFFRNGE